MLIKFINCKCFVTKWQWLFCMCTKYDIISGIIFKINYLFTQPLVVVVYFKKWLKPFQEELATDCYLVLRFLVPDLSHFLKFIQ